MTLRITALTLAVALTGCPAPETETETETDTDTDTYTVTEDLWAFPRIIFASPDLSEETCGEDDEGMACVDIYVGDGTVPANEDGPVPFGADTTYITFVPGEWEVHLVPAGEDNEAENRVLSVDVNLEPNEYRTAVVYGSTEFDLEDVTTIEDDLTEPPAGDAALRVFHASSANATATPTVTIGGEEVASEVTFGSFASAVEIEAGDELVISIDADNDDDADFVGEIDLSDGGIYDLVLLGPLGDAPFLAFLYDGVENEPVQVVLVPPGLLNGLE